MGNGAWMMENICSAAAMALVRAWALGATMPSEAVPRRIANHVCACVSVLSKEQTETDVGGKKGLT